MTLLDLGIVALLVLAAVHGVSQGAAVQVLSFGGLWAGLAIGAAVASPIASLASSPFSKALASLFSLIGSAAILATTGRMLGVRLWSALQRLRLGHADSALGAVIAVVATLMAVWLLAVTVGAGPSKEIASAVQSSAIVRTLSDHLPPQPSVFARIKQLVQRSGFPQVFAGLEPTPPPPVALPSSPDVRAAVAAAGAATVKIVGVGCGGVQEGSGFVAAPGYVVTNAHVVAGIRRPVIEDRRGRHSASAVLFDPRLDVAVLRTNGLAAAPLPISRADARRGDGGAVLGYPGGGPFQAGAAAVLREFVAVGRDIYGQNLTQRNVFQLQAVIRPGNSGGPFVRSSGQVIGVVFAASTTDNDVGYALTSKEVAARLDTAQRQPGAVDTGGCAA